MKITANGIGIRYELEGPEAAPVVVMSHSLAANVAMWDDQMPILSGYRVLRYDTRGHGGYGCAGRRLHPRPARRRPLRAARRA